MAFVGRETRCEHCLFSDSRGGGASLDQLRLSRAASSFQFMGPGSWLGGLRSFSCGSEL